MLKRLKLLVCFFAFPTLFLAYAAQANQTVDISPIFPNSELPFKINIELFDRTLPMGFHSGAVAICDGMWLLIAGRTNGMHGFENNDDNFPPEKQNTSVLIFDINSARAYPPRSLSDESSGLSEHQVDLLSVTSPQSYQRGNTLYITGGYGVDSATGEFGTKNALTAINIPGLINWAIDPSCGGTASEHIRQIFDPIFQITGGYMDQIDNDLTLLVFGQKFTGAYDPVVYAKKAEQIYSEQIRRFRILDDGSYLGVQIEESLPSYKDDRYRRRDLNVVPSIRSEDARLIPYFIAFSGVFTLQSGAWTVPVIIDSTGYSYTFSPSKPTTFKQGMNNYVSATASLYSKSKDKMFNTLFGGISFGFFNGNTFLTSTTLPFINQVTTIVRDSYGHFTQYKMDSSFPTILSTSINPGNALLFGAGAAFFPSDSQKLYKNGVFDYDDLPDDGPTTLGYIAGGIQSTLPNTNTKADSTASSHIFKVTLTKN